MEKNVRHAEEDIHRHKRTFHERAADFLHDIREVIEPQEIIRDRLHLVHHGPKLSTDFLPREKHPLSIFKQCSAHFRFFFPHGYDHVRRRRDDRAGIAMAFEVQDGTALRRGQTPNGTRVACTESSKIPSAASSNRGLLSSQDTRAGGRTRKIHSLIF